MGLRHSLRRCVSEKAISKEIQKKKRSPRKRLKAYDMSSLLEHLPKLKAPRESKTAEFKLGNKRRNHLLLKEAYQLNVVINHPGFQLDPLGAIYQHLQNTRPAMDEKRNRKVSKTINKKTKKEKSKASLQQPMEI
ncbi:hypothetical protein BUALT_Bualt19G0107500 [Buddleja alternifolia]|uniref:Ribosome biogenesis protein slx9-like n=1 Tax=Buddleja alternifolia TaxID=168488 RepID=A0AAV6W3B8_9LAMI|nr:hypothetical protein BUALT_Bualt19G0107500 [Buddleja alternifolia]